MDDPVVQPKIVQPNVPTSPAGGGISAAQYKTSQDQSAGAATGEPKEQGPANSDQDRVAAAGNKAVGENMAGIDVAASDKVAKEEGDEYWENYAREIELEKEIAEMGGVEKVESGEVKVPEKIAAEMGIKPAVELQTPMATVTGFSIRGVALTDEQLSDGLQKPISSGWRWLVEWFIYQLLRARYHIKRIKGKIFREKGPS